MSPNEMSYNKSVKYFTALRAAYTNAKRKRIMISTRIRALAYSLMLSMLSLINGCGSPELSRLASDGTILAFGDSLTVGIGTTSRNSYPSILSDLVDVTVVGSGVSGETTAEGVARLAGELSKIDPDLLILLEGGNDILRNVPPDQIKSNLAQMIQLAQQQGTEVLLIGVPEKGLFSKVAPFYQELAEEYDVLLIENLVGELLRNPRYKSDPIHLNGEGYRVMAESLVQTLEQSGAI